MEYFQRFCLLKKLDTHPDQNKFNDVTLLVQFKMGEIANKKTVAAICMIFQVLLDIEVDLLWQTATIYNPALITRTILLVLQFITLFCIFRTTNAYF